MHFSQIGNIVKNQIPWHDTSILTSKSLIIYKVNDYHVLKVFLQSSCFVQPQKRTHLVDFIRHGHVVLLQLVHLHLTVQLVHLHLTVQLVHLHLTVQLVHLHLTVQLVHLHLTVQLAHLHLTVQLVHLHLTVQLAHLHLTVQKSLDCPEVT